MKKNWKVVELKTEKFIPFDWIDPTPDGSNLGRAEFQVCLKFKSGKVSEFWVYPKQTRLETAWHYTGGDIDFCISSYEGLASTGAWIIQYCIEHKTTSFSVYSPNDARYIEINYHGRSFWKNDYSPKAK